MSEKDAQKYCDLMEEVKLRMNVIDFFLLRKGHALYEPTTLESVFLQFRKILELIAFGSLVANSALYATAYANFATHWHAGRVLRDLEAINPNFYPTPIVEVQPTVAGGMVQLKNRDSDYLAKSDFETLYAECGGIMHARNPYGSEIDYKQYKERVPAWRTRILNLLNCQKIQLVGDPGFWLIHMKEDRDDKVHFYIFKPPSSLK